MQRSTWLKALALIAVLVLAFGAGVWVGFGLGQPDFRLSPMGSTELRIDGSVVVVTYSRPYVRGRVIFGEVVGYGAVWRTGANEATALSTNVDLIIGGTEVPSGDYTLYTIPEQDRWTLIVNRQTGQWGTAYDDSQDLARIEMDVEPTNWLVELFTIRIDSAGLGAELLIEWENTRARVLIRVQDP